MHLECVMIEYEQNKHTCTNDSIQSSWMNILSHIESFIFLNSNTSTHRH